MAYFPNGTAGMVFDEECSTCKYGQEPCPIALVQIQYNYDTCQNPKLKELLDCLVKQDGTCEMKKAFSRDFKTDAHNLKLDL